MRLLEFSTTDEVALASANFIVDRILAFAPTAERPFVLGLPTGGTPVATYKELIALHKAGKVSFANVVTFNMDEYIGIPRSHAQSYWTFMHQNLFDHIDIPKANINILDGNAPDKEAECQRYEEKMKALGGVQLFMGGVGNDGHIAFNEPGSSMSSRTRVKTLTDDTVAANARYFGDDLSAVPREALTIGVGTLMDAKELLILATGRAKAVAVQQAIEGAVNQMWTVTVVQQHPRAVMMVDKAATDELKVKNVNYFRSIEKHEVARLLKRR